MKSKKSGPAAGAKSGAGAASGAASGAAAKPLGHGKKTVGSAAAAVTLAAVTVLSASGFMGASPSGLDSASIITSPPNSVSSRIAGVQQDMARAVQLQQVTPEQAAFLEQQLVRRIQKDDQSA